MSRAGFTLVEAMVGLALVGIVAVAVLGQSAAATRASADAADAVTAAALAEHRIEVLRLLDRRELMPLPDSLRAGRFPEPLDAYQWTARASRVRDQPDLVHVAVVVTWEGGALPLETRWYRP